MLVLSRKKGESLFIGDEIEIVITEISGDKVRIGIVAPEECKILRKELADTINLNREAAGSLSAGKSFKEFFQKNGEQ